MNEPVNGTLNWHQPKIKWLNQIQMNYSNEMHSLNPHQSAFHLLNQIQINYSNQ